MVEDRREWRSEFPSFLLVAPNLRNGYRLALDPGPPEIFMENILVTGANRGIGLALTKVLLANGDIVIAACRKPDRRLEKGPSENYGNAEHTTVAAFLPWRGS